MAHKRQNDLEAIIETIDSCLTIQVDTNDGNAISTKIGECAALIGTSATAVALAEMIYNEKLGEELEEINPKLNATSVKMILQGKLSNELFWLKYAERQNSALVHAIDGYRSMLSFLKEEIKMTSYSPNVQ